MILITLCIKGIYLQLLQSYFVKIKHRGSAYDLVILQLIYLVVKVHVIVNLMTLILV